MPLVELHLVSVFILDVIAWGVLHITISIAVNRIPYEWFHKKRILFRTLPFEQDGELWLTLCKVKKWKPFIPDGTIFIRNGYNKKALHGTAAPFLKDFVIESRRAELTHWLSMPPAFLFFFWNPIWAGWINVVYALLFNIPIIIVQRYNRPRLERILSKQNKPSADYTR